MRTEVGLRILIFPHKIRDSHGIDAVRQGYGLSAFSTADRINVVKLGSEYAVAYWDDEITQIEPEVFVSNLISVFMSNLKGYEVYAKIDYLEFDGTIIDNRFNKSTIIFEEEYAKAILALNNEFTVACPYTSGTDDTDSEFQYIGSPTLNRLYEIYSHGGQIPIPDHHESKPDEQEQGESDRSVYWDSIASNWDRMASIPGFGRMQMKSAMNPVDDLYEAVDEWDYDDKKKKKNKKKKKSRADVNYGISKVIKAANNPKKAYKRHGVIVCGEKSAIKKDERVIKAFLKDFIPGNQEWKKEFRKELGKRWMQVYVVSKKQLKRLERNYRRDMAHNATNINVERTLDFTRKLFNTPIDRWNDPSR